MDDQEIAFDFKRGQKFFSSLQHPDQLWTHAAASSMVTRPLSPGIKQLWHEPNFLHSYVELKNFWSYLNSHVFLTWCSVITGTLEIDDIC
jgi:hypothetical protein